MKKTGIFYGSTTGTTEAVARKLGKMLGIDDNDIINVASARPSKAGEYDNLILGSSTWGNGELQDDWEDFIAGLEPLDLRGKKIAIFGCGDETMSDTFCNAVGIIYRRLLDTGADMIGATDADGYHFDHSEALVDGRYVGLLLDEVNHPELSDLRLRQWAGILSDVF